MILSEPKGLYKLHFCNVLPAWTPSLGLVILRRSKALNQPPPNIDGTTTTTLDRLKLRR
jgi:hypothetical protein